MDLDHLHQDPEEEDEETEETEEAEEALSLSELPLNTTNQDEQEEEEDYTQEMFKNRENNAHNSRRSSSEPPEFFEFFSDAGSGENMCSAEDIIFCGRLIPFKEHYYSDMSRNHNHNHNDQMPLMKNAISFPEDFLRKQTAFRRRSESLSELQSSSVSRSGSAKATVMRNSRSLDYQKLRRSWNYSMVSPAPSHMDRNSSVGSAGKSDSPPKKPVRPRWSSFLMFGMARFPAEMELSDIKNRQVRRNPSTLFPAMDPGGGGNFPVNQSSSSGNKASWRLLKALSCKDHASVAVTASLCMPHV
ncbi:hypothetical protein PanWU01x14_039090 [Parasponia andersonii]|uniref:Uncharacterized protein n=1 Tax=Parasponia andersonii TaxID=3476 RepID=A0A2P5DRP5_PARAD|nr:hypothetical protein PanWU01x14_039090 [Parasponia andersonii]